MSWPHRRRKPAPAAVPPAPEIVALESVLDSTEAALNDLVRVTRIAKGKIDAMREEDLKRFGGEHLIPRLRAMRWRLRGLK